MISASARRATSQGKEGAQRGGRRAGGGDVGGNVGEGPRVPAGAPACTHTHSHTHTHTHVHTQMGMCFRNVFAHLNPSFVPRRLIVKLFIFCFIFRSSSLSLGQLYRVRTKTRAAWQTPCVLCLPCWLTHSSRAEPSVDACDRKPDTHAETISTNTDSEPTRRAGAGASASPLPPLQRR